MASSLSKAEPTFQSILEKHLARYPRMELADIYKLAHQASLGSEHAVTDFEHARAWLERELAELGDGPAEPVEDPISADGRILRVHLRPYLAAGGDPLRLLEAFVRTANEYHGSPDRLIEYWDCVERLADSGGLPTSAEAVHEVWDKMKGLKFPAVHHSARYEALKH
jgi:hypothetical protein